MDSTAASIWHAIELRPLTKYVKAYGLTKWIYQFNRPKTEIARLADKEIRIKFLYL